MKKLTLAFGLMLFAGICQASDVASLLSKHGFAPELAKQTFYRQCSDFRSNRPEVKAHTVCDSERVDRCPYTQGGTCAVDAEFVNGRNRKVSVDYAYGTFDGDRLKSELDKEYGAAPLDSKTTPIGRSVSAVWNRGTGQIRMLRMEGVNVNGQPYNKVSLMFIDMGLPDPFGR
jgi:hypothetical protein